MTTFKRLLGVPTTSALLLVLLCHAITSHADTDEDYKAPITLLTDEIIEYLEDSNEYYEIDEFDGTKKTSTRAIDYHQMHLYTLKQLRYYYPPQHGVDDSSPAYVSAPDSSGQNSEQPYFFDNTGDPRNITTIRQHISSILMNAKTLSLLWSVSANALSTLSYPLFMFSPYIGATSLTAVELPANSKWAITDYQIHAGFALQERDFRYNPTAREATQHFAMFDREHNREGRFILFDQENWWGMIHYPLEVEVTITRLESDESITIYIKRLVANNIQAGRIYPQIISSKIKANNRYQLTYLQTLPEWEDFEQWPHTPGRIQLQIDNLIAE